MKTLEYKELELASGGATQAINTFIGTTLIGGNLDPTMVDMGIKWFFSSFKNKNLNSEY
ncbi:MAG: hypothetical protein Q4A84_09655 [Neisseria sp.]|uniref:hypothetical protein n=1 Tax=Neisseria sp. TaxID=192066 RepID=UPI0026DB6838|nr:hypothetical protein [Neisseria sp.]MDO4641943.1 hypothetical protein [Neisseria sp.]